jgi:hypothetical protein
MENMSDVYSSPEVTQCDNPIHNENISRLTLIEEDLNRSILINENKSGCKTCKKIFIAFLGITLIGVIIILILNSLQRNKSL